MKRREAGKGKEERYTHLNSEFQRITRREKNAFFSNQCKGIEEKNRMGKTRDLFKKISDTKGTFHAKMGTMKDRNGMDLTEAEDIKRWQEYTEELYKKELRDPDNNDGVITHLEPDILECEDLFCTVLLYSCHLFLVFSASVRFIPFLSFMEPIFA